MERIIRSEIDAREKLMEERPEFLADQIGRAYGILKHARLITSKEALNHLSMLRLGEDLGHLGAFPAGDSIDLLIMEIQPAHLQWQAERKLSPEQRDILRADVLRGRLQSIDGPAMRERGGGSDDSAPSEDPPPSPSS
jgi:protein arginine kinase